MNVPKVTEYRATAKVTLMAPNMREARLRVKAMLEGTTLECMTLEYADDNLPCLVCHGGLSDGKCCVCGTDKYKTPEDAEPPVTLKDMLQQIVSAYDSAKRWSYNGWYQENLQELIEDARKMLNGNHEEV